MQVGVKHVGEEGERYKLERGVELGGKEVGENGSSGDKTWGIEVEERCR